MYAAVPRIMPARVAAGLVIVGDMRERRAASVASVSTAFARPKSSTLTRAVGRDLDVGGLQIAMDDAALVRGLERFGNLAGDRQRFVERQRALRDPIGQRRAVDQLQDERVAPSLSSKP